MPRFRQDLDAIPRYIPGKPIDEVTRELGITDPVKLASNEWPAEPFIEVQEAIAEAAAGVNRYPEDSGYYLVQQLAALHGVPVESLWIGAGSTQLIRSIAAAVGGPDTSAVYAWPSFIGYRIATAMAGSGRVEVPLRAGSLDLDGIATAIRADTTVVFVCNPNNPTGTTVPDADLSHFIASVPDDIVVVVDEAYHDFVTAADYASQIPATRTKANVVVLRTFSKVYGLAGLRVGYGIAHPDLIDGFRHTQLPFVVNSLGLVAALEALRHQDLVVERTKQNSEGREYLESALARRSIDYYPSQTNFIAFKTSTRPRLIADRLLQRGIIVRPLGRLLRVSVGLPSENERFVAALDEVLADETPDQ